MFNYSKDGVVVSTVLGARTINKEGKYPVKIKGYYQKRPKYDSIGICMTKEEWNKLPDSKSFEYRKIKQAIESCFSLVRMNVEALVEKGIFSFNTLNLRLGKAFSFESIEEVPVLVSYGVMVTSYGTVYVSSEKVKDYIINALNGPSLVMYHDVVLQD